MNKEESGSTRDRIIELLKVKSAAKAQIYEQSLEVFNTLKDVLSEISNDLSET